MDYKNGKIYKILNNVDDNVYVGSTCQTLSKRMAKHRENINKKEKCNCKLYKHMQQYGKECFYIELIEEYPCETIEQLRKRAGEFIRLLGTLNSKVSGRTTQESSKAYYENNIEKERERCRLYNQSHKDTRQKYYIENKERIQQYRENNKDIIKDKKSSYYEKHKKDISEKRKIKYKCECGSEIGRSDKAKHERSQKHQNYLKSFSEN